MGLFFVSFVLVFVSSYLLTSVLSEKKSITGFLYLPLLAGAQLVLTFEILSLFTAIKQHWVLIFNILFLIVISAVWHKFGRPLWVGNLKNFFRKFKNSLKLDKSLIYLSIAFLVFITSAFVLCSVMPTVNMDAEAYHLARSMFWSINGSLNHFEVSDIRNLVLPINSEILYTWVLLFIKSDFFIGFFSFTGYWMAVISLYGIMGHMGFCTRRRLWVIFILSSLSSVLVQASSTETDIIIAGLLTSSIFLFWKGVKENKLIPIFMSALAYAIAVGTKTPSIIAIPAVGLLFLALSVRYQKKSFYKPILKFLGFGLINFLIFSSYNYILNFIHFGNFMGTPGFMVVSKNYYGLKAIPASLIKYFFMFIDFTGFRWADYVGQSIVGFKTQLLSALHLSSVPDGLYSVEIGVNRTLLEPVMGAGILGFAVYLPCLFWAFIKPLFCPKSKKVRLLLSFALLFVINIVIISYVLSYMAFSVRFMMSYIVLSAPILAYSYLGRKNILKYIIVFFSIFYLTCVSTHLWARPIKNLVNQYNYTHSISKMRERITCRYEGTSNDYLDSSCSLVYKIKKECSKKDKIALFVNSADNIFLVKALTNEGYNIDFRNLEDAKNINFQDYDILITTFNGQISTVMKHYQERKNEVIKKGEGIIIPKSIAIPCMYHYNRKIPAGNPPYQVQCIITNKFQVEERFKRFAIARIVFKGYEDQQAYIFYKKY